MFEAEDNENLFKEVTKEEILEVLKSFKRDKSVVPDGWSIEIFIHFFEIFKNNLLMMMEESRIRGNINPHTNSTYIALIPKKSPSSTFSDFRPISLCNLIYMVISKIIAVRLRSTLSKFISPEQFGF